MSLFGGVIPVTGVSFLIFSVFIVAFVGYLLGRITIKGVNLGTAGVFIIALLFGALFYNSLVSTITQTVPDAGTVSVASSASMNSVSSWVRTCSFSLIVEKTSLSKPSGVDAPAVIPM